MAKQTGRPKCRLCEHEHWSHEPHVWSSERVKTVRKEKFGGAYIVETLPIVLTEAVLDESLTATKETLPPKPVGDGVALVSASHPESRGKLPRTTLSKASLETIEIELPDNPPPPNADKKRKKKRSTASKKVAKPKRSTTKKATEAIPKRKKRIKAGSAEYFEAAAAELDRRRALHAARMKRWRDKKKET